MLMLAVDTSGRNGSLALVRAKEDNLDVLADMPLEGRMYSAQLIPSLQQALEQTNLKKTDIDAFAVASGPGSFTGLRVGLSTVKALSEALHKPIAAVSVLEAAAQMANATSRVIVALDAGRKQVFVGDYDFRADFTVAHAQESLLSADYFFRSAAHSGTPMFSPDAAIRESASLEGVTVHEISAPRADTFARIGFRKLRAGQAVPAETLEANYLRASDAELFGLPKLTRTVK